MLFGFHSGRPVRRLVGLFAMLLASQSSANPLLSLYSERGGCLHDGRYLYCRGDATFSKAPELTRPTALASAKDLSCAIAESKVVCWGSAITQGWVISNFADLKNPRQLALVLNHLAILDGNSLWEVKWFPGEAGALTKVGEFPGASLLTASVRINGKTSLWLFDGKKIWTNYPNENGPLVDQGITDS